MKLSIVVFSVGNNLQLAEQIEKIALKKGFEAEIVNIVNLNLPLYHTIAEEKGIPKVANELKEKLKSSDSFFFIAPEYNGSTPPVFNNTLAWISRTGTDWREALNGKSAAIATHSGGGGFQVLSIMRLQLSFIGMNVIGRQLLTRSDKPLNTESAESILDMLSQ